MLGAALTPLREREFRLLFLGRTVSLFGSAFAPVAIAFAVLDLTGSASDLGLVVAAGFVPQVFFILVGGIWA
ncbi:MAG: MFS transporter, partial [Gaiellaceae bacterium]